MQSQIRPNRQIAKTMTGFAQALLSTSLANNKKLPPLPPLNTNLKALLKSCYFSENAHWLIPGYVMQGQHPVRGPDGQMTERIQDIVIRGGCTTFVCLQAESEPQSNLNRNGKDTTILGGLKDWETDPMNFEHYRPAVESALHGSSSKRPSFLHYGIRDMSPAVDLNEFNRLITILASRVIDGEVLYLHCWGGKGRAGLVAACLLGTLYEQVDAKEALKRVNLHCQLRHRGMGAMLLSPETGGQREQVRQFYELLRQEEENAGYEKA